jgi:hypothetical protein
MSTAIPAHFLRLPFVVDTGGADADTLHSSCSIILSACYGVLDVEAAEVVGARCTGRLTSCGILSSSIIAAAIRVLTLPIAVTCIIANLCSLKGSDSMHLVR